jgi:DNA-binding MarR family transcriptional regulator
MVGSEPLGGKGASPSTADRLIELSRLVQVRFARVAERHDLTPVQAKLLCILAGGPKGMAEMARSFGVEKAALTGLVDRAERNHLVERCEVPGDRRALSVRLTEAGRKTAAEFHAELKVEIESLLAPLAVVKRSNLLGSVEQILDTAAEADRRRSTSEKA